MYQTIHVPNSSDTHTSFVVDRLRSLFSFFLLQPALLGHEAAFAATMLSCLSRRLGHLLHRGPRLGGARELSSLRGESFGRGRSLVAAVEARRLRYLDTLLGGAAVVLAYLAYDRAAQAYAQTVLGAAATRQLLMQNLEAPSVRPRRRLRRRLSLTSPSSSSPPLTSASAALAARRAPSSSRSS